MCSLVIASVKPGALPSEDRGFESRSHDQRVCLEGTTEQTLVLVYENEEHHLHEILGFCDW